MYWVNNKSRLRKNPLLKVTSYMYSLIIDAYYKNRYNLLKCRFKSIGKSVLFDKDINFIKPQNISIGDNVFIGQNCIINGFDNINIGNGCGIAAGVKIMTWNHDINNRILTLRDVPKKNAPVTLEDGVWLGYNVIVLPGVVMGKGSVAAAGAVVSKNVPPFTIVGGIPAVPINSR